MLQCRWRCRCQSKLYKRFLCVIITIQSLRRKVNASTLYIRKRKSAIKIQSLIRMMIAKSLSRKRSNPYSQLSYDELSSLIKDNTNKVEDLMVSLNLTFCQHTATYLS
jgi:hypothetical protein